jgi:hypothetical protein
MCVSPRLPSLYLVPDGAGENRPQRNEENQPNDNHDPSTPSIPPETQLRGGHHEIGFSPH